MNLFCGVKVADTANDKWLRVNPVSICDRNRKK